MNSQLPPPTCKTFLTCRRVYQDPRFNDPCIEGLRATYSRERFPAKVTTTFFAQIKSGRGDYKLEIQLQTMDGDVIGTVVLGSFSMDDQTMVYVVNPVTIELVFPKPGPYEVVLLANGEEIGRETSMAIPTEQSAQGD